MSGEKVQDQKTDVQVSLDEAAFAALERDFHEVLQSIIGDTQLERFQEEYQKLHSALKRSYESEQQLVQKVRELVQLQQLNNHKMATILRLQNEEKATSQRLQAQLDETLQKNAALQQEEERGRRQIEQLQALNQSLRKQTEDTLLVQTDEQQSFDRVRQLNAVLRRELEDSKRSLRDSNEQLSQLKEEFQILKDQKQNVEFQLQNTQNSYQLKFQENEKLHLQRSQLELELGQVRAHAVEVEQKAQEQQKLCTDFRVALEKLADEKRRLEAKVNVQLKDIDLERQKAKRLEFEKAERERTIQMFKENVRQEEEKNTDTLQMLGRVKQAEQQLQKQNKGLEDQIKSLMIQKQQQQEVVESLQKQLRLHEEQLQAQVREQKSSQKEKAELLRTVEQEQNNTHVAQVSTAVQEEALKQTQAVVHNYAQELQLFRDEAEKQRKVIFMLERQCEQSAHSAAEWKQRVSQNLQELRLRDLAISDQQKRLQDADNKLRQKQQLYEQVRADRNLYSKNLVEAQDEIAELRRQFRVMAHVVDQLKQELQAKDDSLVEIHQKHRTAQKQREATQQQLEKEKLLNREAKLSQQQASTDIANLNNVVAEAEAELQRQLKDKQKILAQRDILANQLIRRNDELALLHEKLKIYAATLQKGEKQYSQRVEEIRALRTALASLRRKTVQIQRRAAAIDPYRREISRLNQELLSEKNKTKALTQELQSPTNVHRWRQLEGKDPAAFELIKKVQTYQKRLLEKTEEIQRLQIEKEDAQRLYEEIKARLERHPGPEVLQKLSAYREDARLKTRQLQGVSAELSMFQAQAQEHQAEITSLTQQLQEVKRKFFALKKKEYDEMVARSEAQAEQPFQPPNPQAGTGPRFVGGGYAVVPRTGQEAAGEDEFL